jgi:hypothetical protein
MFILLVLTDIETGVDPLGSKLPLTTSIEALKFAFSNFAGLLSKLSSLGSEKRRVSDFAFTEGRLGKFEAMINKPQMTAIATTLFFITRLQLTVCLVSKFINFSTAVPRR